MTTSIQTFSIPRDGLTYSKDIMDRSLELISYGIWGGLHPTTLRSWMGNFTTDEERYFAACILDNLIYRSHDQTIALIEQLLQRIIPDLSRLFPTPLGYLGDAFEDLKNKHSDPGIRIVASVKQRDPLTKSANEISRFMKRRLSIREEWMIKPWDLRDNIKQGINTFFFIDDFLGTGSQFEELLNEENLDNSLLKSVYVAYVPLVAHEQGIRRLKTRFPNLHVKSVELLDDVYGVFHPQSPCFNDKVNTPELAREFYLNLLSRKKLSVYSTALGFGQLALTYAFEHAAPDNCLPILWWDDNGWNRLFER